MSHITSALRAPAASGRPRPFLIDHDSYATAVIRQGRPVPWTDLAELTGHFHQVHSLLDPDATWVDAGALLRAYLSVRPELTQAMAERGRPGYALRTLLDDEGATEAVVRTLTTLTTATGRPVIVSVPSPARWLAQTHAIAGTPRPEIDEDRADSASLYVAQWLGRLGALPGAMILLDARGDDVDIVEKPEAYTAVVNVCDHLEWIVAMRDDDGVAVVGDHPSIGVVDPAFWRGAGALPETPVLLAQIPATAAPEQVLDRLATLT
ncbi:hypothetical protein BHE97_01660 [Aeromicrobium sp. PE09-221]|uniref:hypothetical protein n=1 Tax=Aeromicrobium sp. PE09-221 TaxID=1898043 RepID=UPI000B3EDC89|nr:hypothetical protein [Aeromicrobium sp. PE09-221]OUZ12443.1 hypothetical protein BHE97_01660 [Aeromicrobium sp. PE09-221]